MSVLPRMAVVLSVSFLTLGGAQVEERNKSLVRRAQEEVWSSGRLDVVDEIFSEDFVCHFLVGPEWQGRADLVEQVRSHRIAFPDWREEIVRLVAEGDFVVTQFISSGTNTGEFEGNPPTGKFVKIHEVAIFRLKNNKIVEQWGFPDIQGLSRQLGIEAPDTNLPK